MMKRIFLSVVMISLAFTMIAQTKKTDAQINSAGTTKKSAVKNEPTIVFSQDFADGEELFQMNKPAEAIPLFEKLIDDKNVNPAVFIYLGVAYYQIEEYQKSLSICVKGLTRADTDHKVLAYNAGNSAYALGNYARADACYAIAIKEDPNFSAAYLNRANAQLKQDLLEEARDNYRKFIEMESENEQRPAIEQLIALLDEEILRRANEKPELITPESLNVANQNMQLPEDIERIAMEDLPEDEENEEEAVVEELLSADDLAAPELPPDELVLEPPQSERVSLEEPPAEEPKQPEPADTEPEETVVREIQQDMLDAEEASRRAREDDRTVEEEIEIPVLPDAEPKPAEEPRNLEKVKTDTLPAVDIPAKEKPVAEPHVKTQTDAK